MDSIQHTLWLKQNDILRVSIRKIEFEAKTSGG